MSSALKESSDAKVPQWMHLPDREWSCDENSDKAPPLVPVFVPFVIADAVYRYAVRLDEFHLVSPSETPTTIILSCEQFKELELFFRNFWGQVKLGIKNSEEIDKAFEERMKLLEVAAQLESQTSVNALTTSNELSPESIGVAETPIKHPFNTSLSCPKKFFHTNCAYQKDVTIKRKVVREKYVAWCFNEKVHPMSEQRFFKLFESHVCSLGIFRVAQERFSAYQNLSLK